MSYYWFKKQKILQKAKKTYSREKAAEYYLQNKEALMKVISKVTATGLEPRTTQFLNDRAVF